MQQEKLPRCQTIRIKLSSFILKVSIIFVLCSTLSARPQPIGNDGLGERWYVGGQLGRSNLEPDISNTPYSISNNSGLSISTYLGYDINRNLSLEAHAINMGAVDIEHGFTNIGDIQYSSVGGSIISYWRKKTDPIGAFNLGQRQNLAFYARLGIGYLDTASKLPIEKKEDIHFLTGFGLEYGWPQGFAARVEWTSFDQDASVIGIGIIKRFGEAVPAPIPIEESTTLDINQPIGLFSPETTPKPKQSSTEPNQEKQNKKLPFNIMLPTFYFASNSALPNNLEENQQAITELVKYVKANAKVKLQVIGHSSSTGSPKHNLMLAKARAQKIADIFHHRGISTNQLIIKSKGADSPIADNKTSEGRRRNRRVELIISN